MIEKIILGTVQLGLDYGINNSTGKPSEQDAFTILNYAHDHNLRILDTAEAYGNAQKIIGDFHMSFPNKKFKVITKFSGKEKISDLDLIKRIDENIIELRVESLYAYMFHNYSQFEQNTILFPLLEKLREEGKIQQLGISLYTNSEIEMIVKSSCYFDFIQIPFNLLDNNTKRFDLISKIREKGTQIHTRSAFLQGLFFKKLENLPEYFQEIKSDLELIRKFAIDNNLTLSELALKYVLNQSHIDYCLIGVDSINQLKDNLRIVESAINVNFDLIDKIDVVNDSLLNPVNWKL